MPQKVRICSDDRRINTTCCTEEELLDYANQIRKVGGGEIIENLFPSTPGDSTQCLIAQALNFESEVNVYSRGGEYEDGSVLWAMIILDKEVAMRIEDDLDWEMTITAEGCFEIILPRELGNSAQAFDEGQAFEEYLNETENEETYATASK